MKFCASRTFLVVYSLIVTVAFCFSAWRSVKVEAAQSATQVRTHLDYDQLTVHRLNIVEPDGTLRLVLSDRARFPGQFLHGKETARPDRKDSAGAVFLNDEGSENGGLLFGGHRSTDGKLHSFGHLSFDEYDSDQTLTLDAQQDGNERFSVVGLSDMPSQDYTVGENAERARLKAMPAGPSKQNLIRAFRIAHPNVGQKPRIQLIRSNQGAAALHIADAVGNSRIEIGVDAEGNPSMIFLDSNGKVTKRWPE